MDISDDTYAFWLRDNRDLRWQRNRDISPLVVEPTHKSWSDVDKMDLYMGQGGACG